jgi:polyferredoxin
MADTYRWLADGVLLVHLAVVVFVLGGLAAVFVGNLRHWPWVNGLAFRLVHLMAIGVVVVQAWLGALCPLTVLESWLREQAGEAPYAASFVEHWVGRVLFYDAPTWVFTLAYSVFAALVVLTWWRYPPRPAGHRRRR